MLKTFRSMLLWGLVTATGIANAGIADDLMALVEKGSTLADAVAKLVAENPAQAGDIVAVASDLLYQLSPEQCALDAETRKPLLNCSEGIVASAIEAGADPVAVTEAAAAGGANTGAAAAPGTGIAGSTGGGGGLTGSAG